MQEITINKIDDLFPLLKENRLLLYRGLSDASYTLKTSLYRSVYNNLRTERSILRNFAKYAANIDSHFEDTSTFAIWRQMVLGQHHGLPTRLLDWSQSPLVGLFFAVNYHVPDNKDKETEKSKSCALWQIDPWEINFMYPDKYKNILRDELFFTLKMLEDNEITLDEVDENGIPILMEPPSIDQRIINQYSCFAVLPAGVEDMEDFLRRTNNSVKYIIPSNLHIEIGRMLDICNVGERVLFPGLDGVCMNIARYKRRYTDRPYGDKN